MRHNNAVTARDLEGWANRREAQSLLPKLVRRLILATTKDCQQIDFPAGEQVSRPGWDGRVAVPIGNAFVPAGFSGWELSVESGWKAKATDDFDKRTNDALGLKIDDSAFIFITPRQASSKDEWALEKAAASSWKEIRVYDSNNLEQWLEMAPSVDYWFAEEIGKRPYGVMSVETYWKGVRASTRVPVTANLFLCARGEAITKFEEFLHADPSALKLGAAAPKDGLDFLAAYFEANREKTGVEALEARCIVVEDMNAWRTLAGTKVEAGLILVCHPRLLLDPEHLGVALGNGHHVVVTEILTSSRMGTLYLPDPHKMQLEECMLQEGIERDRARRLVSRSGGRLSVLRRLEAEASAARPTWVASERSETLVPLILVGKWKSDQDGDTQVLSTLAGRNYDVLEREMISLLNMEDSPIVRKNTTWRTLSRLECFELMKGYLTKTDLKSFHDLALDVLSEPDPRLSLPMDDRWTASFHGHVRKYSEALREGIAETLAMLGAWGDTKEDPPPVALAVPDLVHGIVYRLLNKANTERLCSLDDIMPLLAEAAPQIFLREIGELIRATSEEVEGIFQDSKGVSWTASSTHTGLLWALEGIAWSHNYIAQVADVLCRLDQLDPGGQLINRPLESLRTIFLPWAPQTNAGVDKRLAILSSLADRYPDVAKRLLTSLLPRHSDYSSPSHRPEWRDWHLDNASPVTYPDYFKQCGHVFDLLLSLAESSAELCKTLVEDLGQIGTEHFDRFVEMLTNLTDTGLDENQANLIWAALSDEVAKHRTHKSARWAMPESRLAVLDTLAEILQPQDPVILYGPLFSHRGFDLVVEKDEDESESRWERREQVLFERRTAALKEILRSSEGLEHIFRLGEAAEARDVIGFLLGREQMAESACEKAIHAAVSGVRGR